jgi:hypothetical protein
MSTTTLAQREFRPQNPAVALGAFFVSRTRYINMATEHDIALVLSSQYLRARYDRGEMGSGWEQNVGDRAEGYAVSVATSLRKSLGITVLILLVGVAFAVALGFVRPGLQFSPSKFLTGVGAFFGFWGGLLGAYPPVETFKGEALHEQVHSVMSRLLIGLTAVGFIAALM